MAIFITDNGTPTPDTGGDVNPLNNDTYEATDSQGILVQAS